MTCCNRSTPPACSAPHWPPHRSRIPKRVNWWNASTAHSRTPKNCSKACSTPRAWMPACCVRSWRRCPPRACANRCTNNLPHSPPHAGWNCASTRAICGSTATAACCAASCRTSSPTHYATPGTAASCWRYASAATTPNGRSGIQAQASHPNMWNRYSTNSSASTNPRRGAKKALASAKKVSGSVSNTTLCIGSKVIAASWMLTSSASA